jgi:branched-chain amino acid transport system substrate-binding protein
MISKKWALTLGLLMAAALVVAACAPAPTPPPAESAVKTLVIGFTASQTGKYNVSSTRQVNGLSQWMKEVNDAGGIKLSDGTVVKFDSVSYDDESSKDRVQERWSSRPIRPPAAIWPAQWTCWPSWIRASRK